MPFIRGRLCQALVSRRELEQSPMSSAACSSFVDSLEPRCRNESCSAGLAQLVAAHGPTGQRLGLENQRHIGQSALLGRH